MNRGRLARLTWTVTAQRMGIRRVKGAKRLGVRIGNWLTVEQSRVLLGEPPSDHLRGKRDHAILALLIHYWSKTGGHAGLIDISK